MKDKRKARLMVYLDEAEHLALRHAALDEHRPTTAIVRQLIQQYLAKRQTKRGGKR